MLVAYIVLAVIVMYVLMFAILKSSARADKMAKYQEIKSSIRKHI